VPQQPLEQLVPNGRTGAPPRPRSRAVPGPQGLSHACSPAPVASGLIDWTITPPRNPIVPHSLCSLLAHLVAARPGSPGRRAHLAVRARRHKQGVRPWRPRPRPRRSPSRPGPPPDPRRRRRGVPRVSGVLSAWRCRRVARLVGHLDPLGDQVHRLAPEHLRGRDVDLVIVGELLGQLVGDTPICSACRVTYAVSSAGSTPSSSFRPAGRGPG